jgi:hypothetical protein
MAGYGTGMPITFLCPVARRNRELWGQADRSRSGRLPDGHDEIVRTGRTKPRRRDGNLGLRTLDTSHEYRCQCGHVGWTTHVDILHKPLEQS